MVRNTIVAIGNFDGLHRGHQYILKELLSNGKKSQLKCIVLSFIPHTEHIFSSNSNLLTTEEQRHKILKNYGIHTYFVDFRKIAHLSPEKFVKDILVKKLKAKKVVIGENFQFGHRRTGNVSTLKRLGKKYCFSVKVIPLLKEKGEVISSQRIRSLLYKGNVEEANRLLGHPYEISGRVICGNGRGKRLGFPTANLEVSRNLLLPAGVFAVEAAKNGHKFQGVANIGQQPTFSLNSPARVEVHLFSFHGKLYDEKIFLRLLKRIRFQKKFASLLELQRQIKKDISKAKNLFKHWKVHLERRIFKNVTF